MTGKTLRKVSEDDLLIFIWAFVSKLKTSKLEASVQEDDQAGLYKHLKMAIWEEKRDRSSAYINDKEDILLRDVEVIRQRLVRWFQTLFNANLPKRDQNIVEDLGQWPEKISLGVRTTIQELAHAIL